MVNGAIWCTMVGGWLGWAWRGCDIRIPSLPILLPWIPQHGGARLLPHLLPSLVVVRRREEMEREVDTVEQMATYVRMSPHQSWLPICYSPDFILQLISLEKL